MRAKPRTFLFLILAVGIAAGLGFSSGSAKGKTYTGTVGDALCGIEHSMPVSAIECIRQCIGKGSYYSLIVGDKVYSLRTENKEFLDVFEKQSAAHVQVTGTDDGKIIDVTSVKALK